MRKISKVVISSVLAVSMASMPVMATDINTLYNQRQATESEMYEIQEELTTVLENVNQLELDLIAKGDEIADAEAELETYEDLEETQREAMALRIKYMYEDGTPSLMTAIVSSDNAAEVLNKAEYANELSSYDRRKIIEYVETQKKVAELKDKLEGERTEMLALQDEYKTQQDQLTEMLSNKAVELATIDMQLQNALIAQYMSQMAASGFNYGGGASGGSSSGSGAPAFNYGNASYNSDFANAIVKAAYSQLGVPYKWGASSAGTAFDCSGLVQYCYQQAGISIPRTSGTQLSGGTVVNDPQPGDICWTPGHVGIYIGDGKMIEAQQDGTNVMISDSRADAYVRY